MLSASHVGGTPGSGIVSRATNVLWMSVVRGMRGVGEVCEICMYLTRGGVGGNGVSGLSLGFNNPVRTRECWTCVCVLIVMGLGPRSGGWGGVMSV